MIIKKDVNLHNRNLDENYFAKIHNKIEKNIKSIKNNEFKGIKKITLFDKIYIKYRRKECPTLYNEIYAFIKDNKIPERIKSDYQKFIEKNKTLALKEINRLYNNPFIDKNKSTKEEELKKRDKRRNFRLLIKKNILSKMIDYYINILIILKLYILYDAYIKDIHCSFKQSKFNILKSEYYYEGITQDLKSYIDTCDKCQATKNLKTVHYQKNLF